MPLPNVPLLWLARAALLTALCGCGPDSGDTPGGAAESADADATSATEPPRHPANHEARDFPAVALRGDGEVYVAYQHWTRGADHILVDELTAFGDAPVAVHTSATRVLGTALVADHADALHVVWSEQDARGGFRLAESLLSRGADGSLGSASPPHVLAEGDTRNLQPVLARDAAGVLLLAWQRIHDGLFRIAVRAHTPSAGWGPVQFVTEPARSAWAPAVVSTGAGRFALAWDAAVDGDYDIELARLAVDDDATVGVVERKRVTDSPRFEAWPSLAVAGNRLYVAYETGPEQWGREGSVNKLEVALHTKRSIEIVAVEGDRVAPLVHPLRGVLNENLADSVERPQVRVDGGGNLLVLFRGLPLPGVLSDPEDPEFRARTRASGGAGKGWRSSIWFTYWSRYDGARWTADIGRTQIGLEGSNGRCDAPIVLCELQKGGSAYAVVGDGRDSETSESPDQQVTWWRPVSHEATDITTGRIAKGADVPELPLGAWRTLPAPRAARDDEPFRPSITLADGTVLRLALGDLHRHTDLSRCSSNWDGPITDAIRYGLDAGDLQFLAVTDHLEHMNLSDWWRSVAFMDAYDVPGRMALLRAYERADSLTGHRNVIARGDDIPLVTYRKQFVPDRDDAEAEAPPDLWPLLEERDVLTIPHTPAGMSAANPSTLEWLSFEPRFDRVVEIFQGYRGSSEAHDAPRVVEGSVKRRYAVNALDGGLHFGFIASSDHQSSDGSFAGAWVADVERGAVYDALHARLTFASTARMALWAEWDGVPMGRSAKAPAGPTGGLHVDVELADRDLERIELIVDGRLAETRTVTGRRAVEHFTGSVLDVPAEGTRYAYVRVRTVDGELGWTSPVRLGADGFTGADGLRGCEAFDEEVGKALELKAPFATQWHSCCIDDPAPHVDDGRSLPGAVPRADGRRLDPGDEGR